MLSTPLCAILGIDHPVLNAPMASTATAELAAAVSIAGAFGMLGGSSRGGPDWLRAQIRAVRAKTSRPFGVGFISSFPDIDDLVQVALEEGVAAINHSFADPAPTSRRPMPAAYVCLLRFRVLRRRGAPFPEGIADRVLRNAFTSAWEGRTQEIAERQAELRRELEAASERDDPTVADISAGVAVGLIASLEGAGTIVERIVEEAERVLRERYAALLR